MKTIHFFSLMFVGILLLSCEQTSPTTPSNEVHFNGNTYQFNNMDSICNSVHYTPGDIQIMYGTVFTLSPGDFNTNLTVVFGINHVSDTTAAAEDIHSFFATGNQAYLINYSINNGGGILLYPPGGNAYTSGTADQTGSTFNFTSMSYHNGNPAYVDYTCEFSCNLTNVFDTLDIKPIDGIVSGRFNSEF